MRHHASFLDKVGKPLVNGDPKVLEGKGKENLQGYRKR